MTSRFFTGEDLETRVRQLEEKIALLQSDPRLSNLPFGTLKEAPSSLTQRTIGPDAGGSYAAGVLNLDVATSTDTFNAYLYAAPFFVPDSATMTTIGISVTINYAGGLAQVALYKDKGEKRLYPHKLVTSGAVDCSTTGVKTVAAKKVLARGLYWAAVQTNSSGITIRSFDKASGTWASLGHDQAGSQKYTLIRASRAYAAAPDPYPAGASEYSAKDVPFIFLEFE